MSIEEYQNHFFPHLTQLRELLEEKLQRLVDGEGIVIHSLNGRVKTPASLEKKLARPDRNYQHLLDVTDLLAFRVITYSEDLISSVARLIESTFDVDYAKSVNKLHHEDLQKFGYRSLHYVCSLPKDIREKVPQLERHVRFEVQIRTILQHAWAEIEHDLGYKATEQLPSEFRRRFSQIASLLEVADREFDSIRADLKHYESRLNRADLAEEKVELDSLSLLSILGRDEISKLDLEISEFLNAPLTESAFYPDYLLRAIRAAGLKRIGDVLKSAGRQREFFGSFLPVYFDFSKNHWRFDKSSVSHVQRGYGLLFLAHLHILETEELFINKVNRLTQFYREIDYPDDPDSAKNAARSLVAALKASKLILE
ncbi:MAG: GTP pyrophosphokinase family protein [Oligoflexia bacterium]|nr:GTP pyrophosphokinase family protein [Oligoflexia bacterium]